MVLTGENLRRLVELAGGAVSLRTTTSPPPAGDPGPHRHLTVVIMTSGDVEAAYLSLASLRLSGLGDEVGLVVLDTAPAGPAAWALKALEWETPGLRYLPAGDVRSRTERWDRVVQHVDADWVLCLDAPVLLAPEALVGLLAFSRAHPTSIDLVQGPRLGAGHAGFTTHLEPEWRRGVFGTPASDSRGLDPVAEPFEIPMQDLAVLACRREAWVGGNPHFRGEAGAEGYVHEKVRRAGGRTLCLPSLRWAKPASDDDLPAEGWEEHIRNYVIGWEEVELPVEALLDHFDQHLGFDAVDIAVSRWETDKADPLRGFDGIFCINLDTRPDRWERMMRRFEHLGIADQVRRVPGIETAVNNHVGCALAHRSILETARREGLERVLVFEDDTVFLEGARWVLRRSLAELGQLDWKVLYLGSFASEPFPLADGCHHLEVVHAMVGLHAVAYHKSVYDELLAGIPDDAAVLQEWTERHPIDVFIGVHLGDGVFRVAPMVATQENLISEMDEDLRDQFVLDP